MQIKDWLSIFKQALWQWRRDNASKEAAALAFYTIFSLAPLAVVATGIAGILFDRAAARDALLLQVEGFVGPEAASFVQRVIENVGGWSSGIAATLIGIAILFLGATRVFAQLQQGLDSVWNVKPKPGQGIINLIRVRLLSFGLVLAVGFLLLVSLLVSAVLSAVGKYLTGLLPELRVLMWLLDTVVSLAVISVLFAAIYRYLPDVLIRWRSALTGAVFTAVLFIAGKFLIGLYLGRTTLASAYGAAGSLVIILLWVYYSAQIIFFGAELTQVYASRRGFEIKPSKRAIFEEAREKKPPEMNSQ